MVKRSMKMGRNMKRSMKRSRGQSMKRNRSRRGGQPGEEVIQSGEEVIQSKEKVIQPGEEVIQSEEEVIQPGEEPGMIDKMKVTASETLANVKGELNNQVALVQTEVGQLAEQGKGALASVQESVLGSDDTAVAPVIGQEEKKWYEIWKGGRRRSRSRSRQMKMMGGLNPAFGYNAAPVTDANVAEPTYMMEYTGGKRRRRTCKKRRKCCKKSCRKHHRHHYKR
jgi:hypothetical protein